MRKSLKLLFGILLTMLFISCGSSDESVVEKYLPGTYTRELKEGEKAPFGFYKNLTIEHLKGNEYRITCQDRDDEDVRFIGGERVVTKVTQETPDIYDFEISSITLNEKTDSVSKYFIEGIVTNVVENGKSFSDADEGVNESTILDLIIGKNVVEVTLGGKSLSSIRQK